jgi:hypothetical protein
MGTLQQSVKGTVVPRAMMLERYEAGGNYSSASSVARWVVLRHDEPGGGFHFDWLLERPWGVGGGLVSFRVGVMPLSAAGDFSATRMVDHRNVYLEYEGEISGGRGRVSRVAWGSVGGMKEDADRVELSLGAGVGEYVFERVAGDEWRVRRVGE